MVDITRRQFGALIGAGAATSAFAPLANAQSGQRMVMGFWGGDAQKVLEQAVVAPFLTPQNVQVVFDAASEAPRKVKVLAERPLPRGSYDLIGMSDSGAYELYKNGALEEIDFGQISSASSLRDNLKVAYAVPQYTTTRVIIYRPDKVKEAPTSYADLWKPEYAGKVGLIDIQYLPTIESAALVNGGSVSNYEPGKEKLLELKAKGAKVYPTNEAMAQALQSGECWMCIMWQARGLLWQKAGIPVEIAYPKEGLAVQTYSFAIPKNSRNKAAAYKFLEANLQPKAQTAYSEAFGYNPPLKENVLSADLGNRVGIPADMESKMLLPDNEYLLKNASGMLDWWEKVLKG